MGRARLSERHLSLCFTCGELSRKESAERKRQQQGRQMLASFGQWQRSNGYKVIPTEIFFQCWEHGRVRALWSMFTSHLNINRGISNIGMYFKALTHILLSVKQTAELCVTFTMKHINHNVAERLYEEKTCVDSIGWGTERDLIVLAVELIGIQLSFNRNCYLQTIHLVNRSMSTLPHSFDIGQFKNNGPSQQYTQCHEQCHFQTLNGSSHFSFIGLNQFFDILYWFWKHLC